MRCLFRIRTALILLLVLSASSQYATAQPRERLPDNPITVQIEEARQKATETKWLDAIELYQRILDTSGDELVPVDSRQSQRARWLVHRDLGQLPQEAIALYRKRLDPQAARRLAEGLASPQEEPLRQLLADMFVAGPCEEAILHLARRALDRADFDSAMRYWKLLIPSSETHFPFPKTDPATASAHVALLAILQGDRPQAEQILELLREKSPNAQGLLAGKQGRYIERITELLAKPALTRIPPPPGNGSWPTFAGDSSRGGAVRDPLPFFWPDLPTWKTQFPVFAPKPEDRLADPLHPQSLAFEPILVDGKAILHDGGQLWEIDLSTGRAFVFATPSVATSTSSPARHLVRHSLTHANGFLYARLGSASLRGADHRDEPATSSISCFGPRKPNGQRPVLWKLSPPTPADSTALWEGSPIVAGNRLYCQYLRQTGGEIVCGIACYRDIADRGPPVLIWDRIVGKATDSVGDGPRWRHDLLSLSQNTLLVCTQTGTVAAFDATNGKPLWQHNYPRNERAVPIPYRDLVPALVDGERVYIAPHDANRLLCLDLTSGHLIWEIDGVEVIHLLGVVRDKLIATFGGPMRGIRGLNARTGSDTGQQGWVHHIDGGAFTFGRGIVTDDAIIWPTKTAIFFLDPDDGQPLRSPIPGTYGHLTYADGHLVVTTATEAWGFHAEAKRIAERKERVRQTPDDVEQQERLAMALIDAGRYDEAAEVAPMAGEGQNRLLWWIAESQFRRDPVAAVARYRKLAGGPHDFANAAAIRLAQLSGSKEDWTKVATRSGSIADPRGIPKTMREWGIRNGATVSHVPKGTNPTNSGNDLRSLPIPTATSRPVEELSIDTSSIVRRDPSNSERWRLSLISDPVVGSCGKPTFPSASLNSESRTVVSHQKNATTLFALVDGRDLLAVDLADGRIRWQISGRFQPAFAANQNHLILQSVESERLILAAESGAVIRRLPGMPHPWSHPPREIDGDFLLADAAKLTRIRPETGEVRWHSPYPGSSSNNGRCPRVTVSGDRIGLILQRNFGFEGIVLTHDGRPAGGFETPKWLGTTVTDAVMSDRVWIIAVDSKVVGYSLSDGKQLWSAAGYPETRLLLIDESVVVTPAGGVITKSFDILGAFRETVADPRQFSRFIARCDRAWNERILPVRFLDTKTGQEWFARDLPADSAPVTLKRVGGMIQATTGRGTWSLPDR